MNDIPAGVTDTLDRIRRAWDAGDASAYAAEFTTDANYVIFAGIISHGRDEIRADHVPVLGRWQRGTRMSMRVIDAHLLSDDCAVVVTEGGIGKGTKIRHDKVQTFVFVRQADRWLCASFQNTKRNRLFAMINAARSSASPPDSRSAHAVSSASVRVVRRLRAVPETPSARSSTGLVSFVE